MSAVGSRSWGRGAAGTIRRSFLFWSAAMLRSLSRVMVVVFAAAVALAGGGPVLGKPAVFESLSMDAANTRAREGKRLLVIDAMAEWCGPCKHMDRTTWVDKELVEWMRANCVAVQLDVDKDKTGARKLGVRAMPTIVVFAAGKEIDRKVGGMNAAQMLEWLKSARKRAGLENEDGGPGEPGGPGGAGGGENEKAKRDARATMKAVEDRQRLEAARKLAADGKDDSAAAAYAALWRSITGSSIPDAAMMNEAAPEMRALAAKSSGARKMFAALRDGSAPPEKDPLVVMPADLVSWAALNGVLDEGDKTLWWYETARSNPGSRSSILRVDAQLGPELVKAKRWDDVHLLVRMAVEEDKVRGAHVEWLEAAAAAGAKDEVLMKEARAKAAR